MKSPELSGQTRWALLFGNFVIGCGVMVVAGSLNNLTRSLDIGVGLAGQLITVAALVMGFGAPLLAAVLGGWCRRRLLAFSLLWYAVGHAACALAPDFAWLLPLRALAMPAAAVFTPQAAAVIGSLVPVHERGRAITFIFLGWSLASVLGMPLHSYIGEALGWRWAFGLVSLLALAGGWWVWRSLPDGVKPAPLKLSDWRHVFTHPVLMAMVLVTALSGAGQFTLFSYLAPYYRQVLEASPAQISLLFAWFGAWGLVGNLWVSRHIDRFGAGRAVAWLLACMLLSLVLWPLGLTVWSMALVLLPWAAAGFAANSCQQARLGAAAPVLAPALMALNTSAIYVGQALGAAGGGWMVQVNQASAQPMFDHLFIVASAWMAAALALSWWVQQRITKDPEHV